MVEGLPKGSEMTTCGSSSARQHYSEIIPGIRSRNAGTSLALFPPTKTIDLQEKGKLIR